MLLLLEYLFQKVHIFWRPTYYRNRKKPPRYWGPFSFGEFVTWLFRNIAAPTVGLIYMLIYSAGERTRLSEFIVNILLVCTYLVIPWFIETWLDG